MLAASSGESKFALCLGRGVLEWLESSEGGGAPTVAAWRAALGCESFKSAAFLGPLAPSPDARAAREAACASLLGCQATAMGYSASPVPPPAAAPAPAAALLTPAFGTEATLPTPAPTCASSGAEGALRALQGLVPPPALDFIVRQGLPVGALGGAAWWRETRTLPDAWVSAQQQQQQHQPALPTTLALAPSLEPCYQQQPQQQQQSATPRFVACLGGTFNPPTQAHLLLVAQVLASGQAVDEVWLVPCGPRADKVGVNVSCCSRTILAALAVQAAFPGDHRVRTMPLELGEAGALPSADLFARLDAAAPGHRFALIVGMDCMAALGSWRHPERLLENVSFLVFPRPGYEHVAPTEEEVAAAAAARAGGSGGGGSGGGGRAAGRHQEVAPQRLHDCALGQWAPHYHSAVLL